MGVVGGRGVQQCLHRVTPAHMRIPSLAEVVECRRECRRARFGTVCRTARAHSSEPHPAAILHLESRGAIDATTSRRRRDDCGASRAANNVAAAALATVPWPPSAPPPPPPSPRSPTSPRPRPRTAVALRGATPRVRAVVAAARPVEINDVAHAFHTSQMFSRAIRSSWRKLSAPPPPSRSLDRRSRR